MTTQAEILQILKRLQTQREMGVLFITHDLDLAAAVSGRVSVMYVLSSVPPGRDLGAISRMRREALVAAA